MEAEGEERGKKGDGAAAAGSDVGGDPGRRGERAGVAGVARRYEWSGSKRRRDRGTRHEGTKGYRRNRRRMWFGAGAGREACGIEVSRSYSTGG